MNARIVMGREGGKRGQGRIDAEKVSLFFSIPLLRRGD